MATLGHGNDVIGVSIGWENSGKRKSCLIYVDKYKVSLYFSGCGETVCYWVLVFT